MLAELSVFGTFFPGGLEAGNIKFRAVQWACSEVFLLFAILSNMMSRESFHFPFSQSLLNDSSPRTAGKFAWIFKASALIIFIDFTLTVVWLPVGVSKTYGFQSAKWVFTEYYNGSGAVSLTAFFSRDFSF